MTAERESRVTVSTDQDAFVVFTVKPTDGTRGWHIRMPAETALTVADQLTLCAEEAVGQW